MVYARVPFSAIHHFTMHLVWVSETAEADVYSQLYKSAIGVARLVNKERAKRSFILIKFNRSVEFQLGSSRNVKWNETKNARQK